MPELTVLRMNGPGVQVLYKGGLDEGLDLALDLLEQTVGVERAKEILKGLKTAKDAVVVFGARKGPPMGSIQDSLTGGEPGDLLPLADPAENITFAQVLANWPRPDSGQVEWVVSPSRSGSIMVIVPASGQRDP